MRNNSAFKGPRRNSWSRRHLPSPCLGKEGSAVLAHGGDPRAAAWVIVTGLQPELPSPCSSPTALRYLLAYASGLSCVSARSLPSHLMLRSTGDPRSKPRCCTSYRRNGNTGTLHKPSFSPRCKFRVGDTWRPKLAYCVLCFPKGHEDAGMLQTLLPCSGRGALLSPWMPCLGSLLHSSGLFFRSLGCICCVCSGKHKSAGENDSLFSVQEAVIWGKFL